MHFRKTVTVVMLVTFLICIFTPNVTYAQELNEDHLVFIEKYVDIAIADGAKYDIPWETAMAIGLYESACGTSYSATIRHNFHGLSGGKSGNQNFANDEEGWNAFYENLLEQECYAANGVFQYRDDPNKFLEAIAKAGYNPTPKQYLAKVGPFVKAVEEYHIENGLPSSREYSVMIANQAKSAT